MIRTLPLLLALSLSGFAGQPAAPREAIVRDWMHQDYWAIALPAPLEREKQQWCEKFLERPESKGEAPGIDRLKCFESATDCIVERRMIERVLAEAPDAALEAEGKAIDAPGRDPRWKALYIRACEGRRMQRLAPLLAKWTRFVTNQHPHIRGSWKYTEGLSCAHRYRFFAPGASLDLLTFDGPYGTLERIVDDPDGMIRNPDVSYDGKRVLFAWKKSDRHDDYHLYELNLDRLACPTCASDTRQLTSGRGIADFEGVYLPDGNICFSSTRCFQAVDCNWVEVSNLYLMDGDGGHIRRVGFDQVHTVLPTVTDDGRVLYTRWEYNDRGQIFPQPLFQMNPDGTNQREFYGGISWFPTNIIHARKIPGSTKVFAIATGHHRPGNGKLAVIDPGKGRQEASGVQLVAPVRHTEPVRVDAYGRDGNQFQYPYPLDESHCLVSLALPGPDGKPSRFNIYFTDIDGRRELLVQGRDKNPGTGCRQIVPLAPRPAVHVRPRNLDYGKDTGTFYVQDIHEGLGLAGVPRGIVKRLRVVALQFRCASIGSVQQKGEGGSSGMMTPISVGNACWDVKVVLGSATVHSDGSAFFTAPARTPVYFQALDARGRVVQTMRSWTTLMPGEAQACVGCHEHKNGAPRARVAVSQALAGGPEALEPFYGPARGFSFMKEVQPVLDRHCVRCHRPGKDKPYLRGALTTIGRMKRKFSESYLALTHTKKTNGDHSHPMVNWIDCMSGPGPLPPYHRGSATSKLMTLLDEGHEGVTLSREELDRIACWIDLLVPFCGDYRENNAWSPGDHALYDRVERRRKEMEAAEEKAREQLARMTR